MKVEDIGGETLEAKSSEKLLGMHVSANLDWKVHIEHLYKVLKQRLGLMRRIRHKIPGEKLQIIGEAIFVSKIRYGLAVYSKPRLSEDDARSPEMQKIQVLQNDMVRLIKGYTRSDHINMSKTRRDMKMMSINQLSCYHVLIEVRKILAGNSSEQLKLKLSPPEEQHYDLRSVSKGDLIVPWRPRRGCEGFSYHGSKCYNMLPPDIRETKGSLPYKIKMKKWVFENIPE